ncbi:MAG: choice-of-anchor M domain-containing protein [Verrucomicrobia bacterium]|nr:choice-of-anchor M domain-containing protein [Verrucomicrobiota bacterium]
MKRPTAWLSVFGSALMAGTLHLQAHVHVQVGYSAGVWDLFVLDFESGRFAPDEYPFLISFGARRSGPLEPSLAAVLGTSDGAWILPESEAPGLLNLGVGTSEISAGQFAGDRIGLELHRLEGPGQMALYTTSAFGSLMTHWISQDGLDPANDAFVLPAVNGHAHVNWVFTQPGAYRLGLAASATASSTGQITRSPVVDFTFWVEGPKPPQLRLTGPQPDGSVELHITAPAGFTVEIQAAPDVNRWTSLGTLIGTGEPQSFIPSVDSVEHRFFRAVLR